MPPVLEVSNDMSTKSEATVESVDVHANGEHANLNDYRLLKLNAYQGQNSWDFTGRDSMRGPYPFPYHGMKVLDRKE